MERITSHRSQERPSPGPFPPPPPMQYPPPTSQHSYHMPPSDPFHTNRDPFHPGLHSRQDSLSSRAWQPSPANGLTNGHHHPQRTPPPQSLHAPPATNGLANMSLPYDPSRRRSLGGPGSPPQNGQGGITSSAAHTNRLMEHAAPREHPLPPPSFQSRQMPPPSPPQMPNSASSLPGSAPRGPPTASPFPGIRDIASFSSNRAGGGMSISSILGNSEERKSQSSPQAQHAAASPPKSMPPPSPGRARSSSMREGYARGYREPSPPRNYYGEQRPSSAVHGHDRVTSEPRREGMAASPIFQHGFRPYQPPQQQEQQPGMNGFGPPERPKSQPTDQPPPPRSVEDIIRRDAPPEGRFATFRQFEPHGPPPRSDMTLRQDTAAFPNGHGPQPQPTERAPYSSPLMDRERERGPPPPMRFHPGTFGTPMGEERTGLFRLAYPPGQEQPRESIEMRPFQEVRREPPRSSPPLSDLTLFERGRNGFIDRPMTYEDHQRLEAQRDPNRKESDGSAHRALLNISPELNRKGRNSPLPQAVQGAQPRHIGPGGDNPGIKMEFGRMFSGLGSGVGTATPTAGQSMNGTTTPSRMSPSRHVEGGDLVRTAVAEIEEGRGSGKRGVKKGGRRSRDEERLNGDTPDGQRGGKKAKTSHSTHHHHHTHPHHHHHHHHEPLDNGPSPFNMLRFPPNPIPPPNTAANPPHHHHHHQTSHAHPGHHHHHPPRAVAPPRKAVTTVTSERIKRENANKPRKHLGSQLYTTEVTRPPENMLTTDLKNKFATQMVPIPNFKGKENCTYTVRVPREYLGRNQEGENYFEEICRRRQIWGTDVYTDDSDIVAAAVHSGWLKGDFGEFNEDIHELCHPDENEMQLGPAYTLLEKPPRPVTIPPNLDAHVTVLILPPLENYVGLVQNHVLSREWKDNHDGMSFMIQRIDFVDEGSQTRNLERGIEARKARLKKEQKRREEAAAGLLMFANGHANGHGKDVSVGA